MLRITAILIITLSVVNVAQAAKANTSPLTIFDLAVVGPMNFADGIGRQAISVIDMLKDDLTINYVKSRKKYLNPQDINPDVLAYAYSSSRCAHHRVALFEDFLPRYKSLPSADIRIAYTMFESTQIPTSWVNILNCHFDAAVVPDKFLVEVYMNSGVKIPIFILPIGLYLEDFLKEKRPTLPKVPFIYGNMAAFDERKDQLLLLKSFHAVFGNNPNVILKINGRRETDVYHDLKEYVKHHKLNNVIITAQCLSWSEYKEFLAHIDCYVSLSRGEGFSIIPREALAFSIPCIISDNTGQSTICSTNYVYRVPSLRLAPAYYAHLGQNWGYNFTCQSEVVQKALKDVYNNYPYWLNKARQGRTWVKRYLFKNLKDDYLTLIKPQKIRLGSANTIKKGVLTTTSLELYEKYHRALNLTSQ